MASDVIRMRLHLRRIRTLEVVEDTSAVLRVRVESTQTRVACPHCGATSIGGCDKSAIMVGD